MRSQTAKLTLLLPFIAATTQALEKPKTGTLPANIGNFDSTKSCPSV